MDSLASISYTLGRQIAPYQAELERAGLILPLILFLSPVPQIWNVWRTQSVGNLPPLPFTSMFGNCSLWLLFGVGLKNSGIITPNIFGASLGLLYCFVFRQTIAQQSNNYMKKRDFKGMASLEAVHTQLTVQLIGVMVLIVVGCLLLMFDNMAQLASNNPVTKLINDYNFPLVDMVGILACTLNCIMGCSPLANIGFVLATNDASHLGSLPMAIAGFACSVVWSCLGWFFYNKAQVWIPNGLGFVANGIAILLFVYCMVMPKKTPKGGAKGVEMGRPSGNKNNKSPNKKKQ